MKLLAIIGILAILAGASVKQADLEKQEEPWQEIVLEICPREEESLTLLTENGRERLPEEEYLTCVVLSEMPPSFPLEALKAQAVAARTYTKRKMQEGKHGADTLCSNSACCQAYCSREQLEEKYGDAFSSWWDKAYQAVTETRGQVLEYDGKLIDAVYYSCSGGKTEDAAAVWGSDVPYLQSVESPGEEDAPVYAQTVSLSPEAFRKKLCEAEPSLLLPVFPQDWLGETVYTRGGGVATMQIGSRTWKGTELRKILGLPSTAFTVELQGSKLIFSCRGYGHRVGMSQYGAKAMAEEGKNYTEILWRYYSGAVIKKLPCSEAEQLENASITGQTGSAPRSGR